VPLKSRTTAPPAPIAPGPPPPVVSGRGRAAATFAASITLNAVAKDYDGKPALDGFSLEIAPGEIICLLGPSGCGKTTLLRVISGIERPTSGRVLINGSEVAGPERFVPPEKRGVGLMFQDFALFPHLSILDNVMFGLRGLDRIEAERAARAILDRVGMLAYAAAYPSTLSGGQQQRVALARAIVPRPAVMLMDEPFSGLDVQLRETMQEETLALLRETRATSLIVTHHPEEAMRLGDRIAVLNAGRAVQVGRAEELYASPASLFVARLFSEINELPCHVKSGRVDTAAGSFAAGGLADGRGAVLCVRERAIRLTAVTEPAAKGLNGRVLAQKFLGDVTRLDVAVEGFERPLKVRAESTEGLKKGADVRVTIDPAGVLVFPADGANVS
jgi:iron(III) transport system ATP-binding protein